MQRRKATNEHKYLKSKILSAILIIIIIATTFSTFTISVSADTNTPPKIYGSINSYINTDEENSSDWGTKANGVRIYMAEHGSYDVSSTKFDANFLVYRDKQLVAVFTNCSTLPDMPKKTAKTAKKGWYPAITMDNEYNFFPLRNKDPIKDYKFLGDWAWNTDITTCLRYNGITFIEDSCDGVYIHKAGVKSSNPNTPYDEFNPWSTGCLTIKGGTSEFCNVVGKDTAGKIYIVRDIPAVPVLPPLAPNISISGNNVTVSWQSVANATSYDVYLVQSPWGWENITNQQSVSSSMNNCTFTGVSNGEYAAFFIARPNADTAQSAWSSFSVQSRTIENIDKGVGFCPNNGNYVIYAYNTNYALEIVNGGYSSGDLAQVWSYVTKDHQQMNIKNVSGGANIIPKHSKLPLYQYSNGTVAQHTADSTKNMNWLFYRTKDGYCYITNIDGDKCLTFNGNGDGASVSFATITYSNNQKWNLFSLDNSISNASSGVISGAISNDFEIKDGELVKYNGTAQEVTIPNGITTLGYDCFAYNNNIVKVTIPSSVTLLNQGIFYSCTNLKAVVVPSSVTEIGQYAFWSDSLTVYCQKDSYAYNYVMQDTQRVSTGTVPALKDLLKP